MKKLLVAFVFVMLLVTGFSYAGNVEAQQTNTYLKQSCIGFICWCASYTVNSDLSELPDTNDPCYQGGAGPFDTNNSITSNAGNLSSLDKILVSIVYFINNILLPLLFAIALLLFLVNAVRFFIIQSDDEEGRKKARRLMIYGIAAFVFLVSIWGIVNLIVTGLQLNSETAVCPDYLPNTWCTSRSIEKPDRGGSIFINSGGL